MRRSRGQAPLHILRCQSRRIRAMRSLSREGYLGVGTPPSIRYKRFIREALHHFVTAPASIKLRRRFDVLISAGTHSDSKESTMNAIMKCCRNSHSADSGRRLWLKAAVSTVTLVAGIGLE